MWDRLTLVAPPTLQPVTVVELKSQSRIDSHDDDVFISDLIDRAVSMIDGPRGIGHCLMPQTWRLALDSFSGLGSPYSTANYQYCQNLEIVIPLGPVASVSSIKYLDQSGTEQTLAADQYWVNLNRDPVRITPAYGVSWPSYRAMPGSIKIEFVAGYGSAALVPSKLRAAVLMLAAHWFENRSAVIAEPRIQPYEMPLSVERCLADYRAGVVA